MKSPGRWPFLPLRIHHISPAKNCMWTAGWGKSERAEVRIDKSGRQRAALFGLGLTAVRRIGGVSSFHIKEPGVRGVAGRIAIAVRVITRRAANGALHPTWRLCELPNRGIGDSACRWRRRILRECAAGRRRADIVENEISEIRRGGMRADIVRGGDRAARFFLDGDSGAVRARTITCFR